MRRGEAARRPQCVVARGLPREQMKTLGARPFAIAGAGVIESLNVASTVNICMYELNRQPT